MLKLTSRFAAKKMHVLSFGFFLCIVAIFSLSSSAHAQVQQERQLSVSPLRTELTLAAGTSATGTLTIYNPGKEDLTIQMNTQLFTVSDGDYNYSFDENSLFNQWVRYSPANFTLDAGKSKKVEYSVNVPITASHGDKYFSMFASTTPSQSADIKTTERVGSLIYLTVPGDISRTGKLLSIRSPILTFEDSTWSANIQNTGSSLFRSHYTVTVKNIFGQELKKQEDSALILANTIRLVSNELTMPAWLGIYKVEYSFELGDNATVTVTKPLIYAPFPQVILLAVLLVVIISPIVSRKRKHSTKKKSNSSEE